MDDPVPPIRPDLFHLEVKSSSPPDSKDVMPKIAVEVTDAKPIVQPNIEKQLVKLWGERKRNEKENSKEENQKVSRL